MAEHQVTCITKPAGASRHEHITHIGNSVGHWRITRQEAIRRIEAPQPDEYYVLDARTGKRAVVRVVREAGKDPYLRTQADGVPTDNLLSLPECPTR